MKKFKYTIKDQYGIHAKPASILVHKAQELESDITITRGERTANAKKVYTLMSLAVKCGDTILVTVEGETEEADAEALRELLTEIL